MSHIEVDSRPVPAVLTPMNGAGESRAITVAIGAKLAENGRAFVLLSIYCGGHCVSEISVTETNAHHLAELILDRAIVRS